jgi:hypothetical protein
MIQFRLKAKGNDWAGGASTMPALTYWFTGAALGAFLALVATVSTLTFAWYRAAVNEAQTAERSEASAREAVLINTARDRLGVLLAEGADLLRRTRNENDPAPIAEADAWASRTEDFLTAKFGSAYVIRFRDHSGLPPGFTSLQSADHRNLESGIQVRTARLQQFLAEMPATGAR